MDEKLIRDIVAINNKAKEDKKKQKNATKSASRSSTARSTPNDEPVIKRKRGRPPGSTNKKTSEDIKKNSEEPVVKKKRGRPPGSKAKGRTAEETKNNAPQEVEMGPCILSQGSEKVVELSAENAPNSLDTSSRKLLSEDEDLLEIIKYLFRTVEDMRQKLDKIEKLKEVCNKFDEHNILSMYEKLKGKKYVDDKTKQEERDRQKFYVKLYRIMGWKFSKNDAGLIDPDPAIINAVNRAKLMTIGYGSDSIMTWEGMLITLEYLDSVKGVPIRNCTDIQQYIIKYYKEANSCYTDIYGEN